MDRGVTFMFVGDGGHRPNNDTLLSMGKLHESMDCG
jgi:hypothetical protein